MKSRSLFIHATNVHQGGGYSLLTAIINNIPSGIRSVLSLDSRMCLTNSVADEVSIKRVKPSILQRLLAERWLAKQVALEDIVLSFGNLPPLFKLRGRVVVFVQNRYLIDNEVNLAGFSFKTRLRLSVERLWFALRMSNVDEFIVQTPSMRSILEARMLNKIPISVIPFMENHTGYARQIDAPKLLRERDFDFLYVASGEPHKNHRKLIEAWCLLAKEGVYPSLKLTLDNDSSAELCAWITQKVSDCQLNVENKGRLTHDQVKLIYNQAGALIYPSTFESFGLPLIEARQAGLPILASELDYVRDVLDPEQGFDPESAVSIARAVKRFIAVNESPLLVQNATGFIQHILNRVD